MTERSTKHSTFVLERTYNSTPAKVFQAFADKSAKEKWFSGPPDWVSTEHTFDFRVGGTETSKVGPPGGTVHAFNAVYQDIIPDQRIVFSYEMLMDENRISVSLTTVEISPKGDGTLLTFTEQGVFLDDYDDAGSREQGSNFLLDALGKSLED